MPELISITRPCSYAPANIRKLLLLSRANVRLQNNYEFVPLYQNIAKVGMPFLLNPTATYLIDIAPKFMQFGWQFGFDEQQGAYVEVSLSFVVHHVYEAHTLASMTQARTLYALVMVEQHGKKDALWLSPLRTTVKADKNGVVFTLSNRQKQPPPLVSDAPAFVGTNTVLRDFLPIENNYPYFAVGVSELGERWKIKVDAHGNITADKWVD